MVAASPSHIAKSDPLTHMFNASTTNDDVIINVGNSGKDSTKNPLERQLTNDPDAWNIDGTNGDYHHLPTLRLVIWAQIIYIVSLTIIIPSAGDYTTTLGHGSAVYFGLVVGISSIVDPLFSRVMAKLMKGCSLSNVMLIMAMINMVSCIFYALAKQFGGAGGAVLLASRVLLGLGSVQTACLQYLGCAVSKKKATFTQFITTSSISYGFAFGIFIAFLLSIASQFSPMVLDQNTLPGWFSAALWLVYMPIHCCVFREPNKYAGIIDSDSSIRLGKSMKPVLRHEAYGGIIPCVITILAVAVVTSAFEVLTISITQDLWKWNVMKSASYLAGVMFFVALTTLLAYPFAKWQGQGRTLVMGMVVATSAIPFFYLPVSGRFHDKMGTTSGMVIYLFVSIIALSFLNISRTISFTLMTELPSPQWRDHFLSSSSQLFTVGRGIGPVLAGALATQRNVTISVLLAVCAVAAIAVCIANFTKKFAHEEHEVGPARAEQMDQPKPSWLRKHSTWSRSWSIEEQDNNALGNSGTPPPKGVAADSWRTNPMMP